MLIRKKIILIALINFFYSAINAQNAGWMAGTWKTRAGAINATGNANSSILIDNVSGESFTGTKTMAFYDGQNSKITITIAGFLRGKNLFLQDGQIVKKEPANSQWHDCSACTQVNKMFISGDSLILINSVSGCEAGCDAINYYFRLLSEYDSTTQRYLVDWFGRPSDIIGFRPFQPKDDKIHAVQDETEPLKKEVAGNDVVTDAKRVQQMKDSMLLVQQKKREQEITDSLNLVKQSEKLRIKDSMDNVAMLEQIRQRAEDSLRNIQEKKRQKEIADSIQLVQQRLTDSLNNVARLEKIKMQTEDSLRIAFEEKRKQEIADSLNLAQQKRQQQISDSLKMVAAQKQQKQKTEDSIRNIQAVKKQKEMDSLAIVRLRQYNDSLQKAALVSKADSISNTADKELKSRNNVLLQTYHITAPDILIELFDNGEIDGDRVSVYHNNVVIISNQMLGLKPISINIKADTAHREHEFVLVAENLGKIPPNSALMRITAGKQVYKLMVNTDLKTNARIVFYYDGN